MSNPELLLFFRKNIMLSAQDRDPETDTLPQRSGKQASPVLWVYQKRVTPR